MGHNDWQTGEVEDEPAPDGAREPEERGWNSGSSSVGDVYSNLRTVADELKWPIFALYLISFVFVFIAMGGVFMASEAFVGESASGEEMSLLVALPGFAAGWLMGGTVFFSLLGTGRRALMGEDRAGGFFGSCVDALRRAPRVFVAVFVVTIAQAMLICLPGLVFAALSPIPYLVATRDELSITESIWEGVGWFKRHVVTLVASYALVTLAYGAAYVLMWVLVMALAIGASEFVGGAAGAFPFLLGAVGFIALQLMNFAGIASAFYTIDAAESGRSLNSTN